MQGTQILDSITHQVITTINCNSNNKNQRKQRIVCFKSIVVDENSRILKIFINLKKITLDNSPFTNIIALCILRKPLHCLVDCNGIEKTTRNIREKYYLLNLTTWLKFYCQIAYNVKQAKCFQITT